MYTSVEFAKCHNS